MPLVADRDQDIQLFQGLEPDTVVLWNGSTGESALLHGKYQLRFSTDGHAFLTGATSKQSQWVRNILSQRFGHTAAGDWFVQERSSEGVVVSSFVKDLRSRHVARYTTLAWPSSSSDTVLRLKVSQARLPQKGMRLFWQLRDFQDLRKHAHIKFQVAWILGRWHKCCCNHFMHFVTQCDGSCDTILLGMPRHRWR